MEKKHNRAAVAAALVAFYNGNKPAPAKEEPILPAEETVYADADYNTGYDPDWARKAEEERTADREAKKLESREAKDNANAQREAKELSKYETHEQKALREREMRDELLLTYKEEIAREKAAKAAAKAAMASVAPKAVADVVYPDFTEAFDKAAYDAEKKAEADKIAKAKADAALAKADKKAQSERQAEEKIASNYEASLGKSVAKLEKEAEMLALDKQYRQESKERAEQKKALDKALAEAKRNEKPEPVVYPDFTELFDEEAYNAQKQAELDAKNAPIVAKREEKLAKEKEKSNQRDIKLISQYDKKVGERLADKEEKAEMLTLVKQDDKEKKAAVKAAKAQVKADREAALLRAKAESEITYPDPEHLPDEFDYAIYDVSLPEPGDVLEGKAARITSVAELRRLAKEDKELTLLIKRDKRLLKKTRYDLETLKLAEQYVEDGALEMADTKTVMRDAKLARREERDINAVKEYEKDLENKEMLYFAEDYAVRLKRDKRRLKKAKKYGKFMLEYGSTYDPEWDGDFNNYGLPEIHPFTEGVKLSKSRRRTPKKERFSNFDKKNLTTLAREQCNTDNKMIEARVRAEYTELELEVSMVEHEFSGEYRSKKEKRWLRNSKEKLKHLKTKIATALKYEKLDNERYYSVVATDFDRVELPAKSDRDELIAMREELMRLLDIRDDINAELLELYSGKEHGMRGSLKGRAKATLRARRWAHARLNRYYKVINKHRVTRNEKLRIFDKMDEVVELKGDIARANYILRKEKPTGKVKRDYKKERAHARRDVRILKKSIDRLAVRAVIKARKREKQLRTIALAYAVLGLFALGVVAFLTMGPQLLESLKLLVPENFHGYIDMIISKWPL